MIFKVSFTDIYVNTNIKDGLSLKIKNIYIHLYFLATKY